MTRPSAPGPRPGIGAVVVTYDSAAVIGECLESLVRAAPRRGIDVCVVDNASRDEGPSIAERVLGRTRVIRNSGNRGYAAGVNAGLAGLATPWVAVVNPDTRMPEGALDLLADELERFPRSGLIGPRIVDHHGRPETSVGLFPNLARERAHTWMLDRVLGREGRRGRFPGATAPVDWVSGCLWLMRSEAWRAVGPLDEDYFMYYEDVDYCRRMRDAGWQVLATPAVQVVHGLGRGSSATPRVPADGGDALVRYFRKFHPHVDPREVEGLLRRGWWLRLQWRRIRIALGDRDSVAAARRYQLALGVLAGDRAATPPGPGPGS